MTIQFQCGGKNIRLVLMNNLLPSGYKIHLKYDLKVLISFVHTNNYVVLLYNILKYVQMYMARYATNIYYF